MKQAIQAVDDAEDRVKLAKQALEKLVAHQAQLGGKRSQLQSHEVQLRSQLLEAKGMNVIVKFVRRVDPDKINKQLADLGHDLWKVNEELKAMVQSLGAAHAERAQSEEARDQAHAFYLSLYDESCHLSPFIAPTQELRQAIQQAQRQIEEGDRLQRARDDNQLSPEHRALQNDLERLGGELAEIESRLANLEIEIVTNAQVVATTLTKVYMGTAVRDRQFDVLILDEASIAQLPAVYIAATCATQRVIVFGDPYQLAPIVKANQDLYAKRWLGRDLFAVAKVTLEGASQGDPCSALLDEQFRMHPAISVIARKHVYRGLLRDAPQEKHDRRYENIQPMPGRPLVLCDTGDANPVQERSQSGRRNTHHINCVLALAKKVLATLPPALSTDNNPRIGIVTPYRRQANELLKQINADKLTEFVRAGTVHKFQGLEFEVVIFDTVESQGADPSVHFSRGEIGSEAMRLVNVAVTRPKHKLIIVANFQWLRANLAKSDILMLAVEEAAKAAVLRSGEIVPLKR